MVSFLFLRILTNPSSLVFDTGYELNFLRPPREQQMEIATPLESSESDLEDGDEDGDEGADDEMTQDEVADIPVSSQEQEPEPEL